MSTAVMTAPMAASSQNSRPRLAGLFWLLTILTGTVAMFAGRLIVFSDAAATAANIQAHESMFRWGLTADLAATACYVAATLFVYELLAPVNRSVSLLAAFFSLIGCASAAAGAVCQLAPLVVLGRAPYLSVFTLDQLHALALTFLRMRALAGNVSFVFFGLHCLLVGVLVFRSMFLPRTVGVLMVLAGLGWLTSGLANLVAPELGRALSPYILLPGILGETSLTLWLLVMGVKKEI